MAELPDVEEILLPYAAVANIIVRSLPRFEALVQQSGTRCPSREELRTVLDATEELADAMAGFLDNLDRCLGNEGAQSGASDPLPHAWVKRVLAKVEPSAEEKIDEAPSMPHRWSEGNLPAGMDEQIWRSTWEGHPGRPKGQSAFGMLPALYGILSSIDNDLYEKQMARSYAWREIQELWVQITYFGGATASGGLTARLQRVSEVPGRRTGSRADEYYPWDREDIVALRDVARRAAQVRDATQEDLEHQATVAWCRELDSWLEILEADGGAADNAIELLLTLVNECPEPQLPGAQKIE